LAVSAVSNPPLVIVDASYIAHRAKWTTGHMEYRGRPTGVLFGFLNQIKKLRKLFPANSLWVFAWDSIMSFRREMYPDYKARRKEISTPEEIRMRDEFYHQMNLLRPDVLEPLGFRSHIKVEGFEADDIIASLCFWNRQRETFIVSADHDLFQCLDKATMFLPNKGHNYTAESLHRDYGCVPYLWPKVLAIAGCDGDNVPGVFGVGDKTAAKYVVGESIRPTQEQAIKRSRRLIERNMVLVKLPFKGKNLVPPGFSPSPFKTDSQGLARIRDQFGFDSLRQEDWR